MNFVVIISGHDKPALGALVIMIWSLAVNMRQEIPSVLSGITTLDTLQRANSFVHMFMPEHMELEIVFMISKV